MRIGLIVAVFLIACGATQAQPARSTPNAPVCLKSDPESFLRFYLGRVGKQ